MAVLIVVLVLVIVVFACGGLAFHMSIKRGGQNILPKNFKGQNKLPFKLDTTWLKQSQARDVYLNSADGLRLHAYLAEQGSNKWAVICHGYTAMPNVCRLLGKSMPLWATMFCWSMPALMAKARANISVWGGMNARICCYGCNICSTIILVARLSSMVSLWRRHGDDVRW